ncbi:hypothetical protein LCGC14_2142670 [marine sediment metagenome]|uniref:Uncharacterized protein n=1 Tax=marine sediment metagenome TaxID=412755 RepID=A0A0F9GU46_9ZZZZ
MADEKDKPRRVRRTQRKGIDMAKKYNPFTPNQPTFTGMFAGRINEIVCLDKG